MSGLLFGLLLTYVPELRPVSSDSAAVCLCCPGWTPEGAFLRPPKVAHPGVWWHWMGAQVTEAGIVRDLDWFVRMGITWTTSSAS